MTTWKQKLARIFKPGYMPEDVKTQLESEGIELYLSTLTERFKLRR